MTRATGAAGARARSLRVLLAGAIDYAGLFPPAALPMPDAVREFATHAAGPDAWALGRFVVPAGRLEELASAAAAVPVPDAGWRLSVLIGAAVEDDAARAAAFRARATRFTIEAVEGRTDLAEDVAALARSLPAAGERFVELPMGAELQRGVEAARAAGVSAKIRSGGVTPGAFPAAADVVAFLRSCRAAGIAIKATAGLHHPVRGEYPLTYEPRSAVCTMYGFLNVLLASVLAWQRSDDDAVLAVLTERDPAAFRFDEASASVGGHRIPAPVLASARREFIRAIGSCSFQEPMDGLATLPVA